MASKPKITPEIKPGPSIAPKPCVWKGCTKGAVRGHYYDVCQDHSDERSRRVDAHTGRINGYKTQARRDAAALAAGGRIYGPFDGEGATHYGGLCHYAEGRCACPCRQCEAHGRPPQ